MARSILIAALLSGFLYAQAPPAPVEPPEEDETLIRPEKYEFNPLQAKKEMSTGDFYAKKGNTKAAAARYREATLWDEGWPEAFFKFAEASEKLKNYEDARAAYTKFAALTTDKKKAEDARKRITKLPKSSDNAADPAAPLTLDQVPDLERVPGAYNRTINQRK